MWTHVFSLTASSISAPAVTCPLGTRLCHLLRNVSACRFAALSDVLTKFKRHKAMIETARQSGRELLPVEKVAARELSAKRIEVYLDAGCGTCAFGHSGVADLVTDTLKHWDAAKYDLLAWCVMPNHVHVVFRLFAGERLESIVRSWKSFIGRRANAMLGRTGTFWQREYYDRLIRSEEELERAIEYVLQNPIRAGLKNWRWVGEKPGPAGLESGATLS